MKFLLSFLILFVSFISSAETTSVEATKNTVIEVAMPGDRGKKARKNKRINKKRKRKCQQFGRRGFAG